MNTIPYTASPAERRYLALFLPRWATDCYKRRHADLAAASRPLVLYEQQGSALRIVSVDAAASGLGLLPGQSLSDARALVPYVDAREIDRPLLTAAFADFADWHSYASPIVSILTDVIPFGDLVLDITGVSHLFGGEEAMLQSVLARLKALGLSVSGAIASQVGTAWALAHFASCQVLTGPVAPVLADLPAAALRLSQEQAEGLRQLGLKRIGQLYRYNRKALQARFGLSLLQRLDQALGRLPERIVPRLPIPERYSERRFAEPIELIETVLMATNGIARDLTRQLEREGLGAQSFQLFLYRVDHKVMTLTVNAARATRDPNHIVRLFHHRTERLADTFDAGFGIDMIRLAAATVSRLDASQIGAFEHRDGAEDVDRLHDRLASRLGPAAVLRPVFANTHIPEYAVRLEPVLNDEDRDPEAEPNPDLERPLRLFPDPEPVRVTASVPDGPPVSMVWRRSLYRFVKAAGPERIGPEWWQGRFHLSDRMILPPKPGETEKREAYIRRSLPDRDYYVAEDQRGRRFWLFREDGYDSTANPAWFMHGLFA